MAFHGPKAQVENLEPNTRDSSFSEASGKHTRMHMGASRFTERSCLTASEKREARLSVE